MRMPLFILITLTALIACAHSLAHADATADLFTAIKEQNIKNVEKALEMGADTDVKRSSDNLNAKAFSVEQINLICHTPVPLFVSSASPLALLIASFLGNKQHALIKRNCMQNNEVL